MNGKEVLINTAVALTVTAAGIGTTSAETVMSQKEQVPAAIVADTPLPIRMDIVTFGSSPDVLNKPTRRLVEIPYLAKNSDKTANNQGIRQKGRLQLKIK